MGLSGPESASIVFVLGSRNRKKCAEMAELIAPPWEPSPRLGAARDPLGRRFRGAPEVVEDADSFAGNARKKATELARAIGVGHRRRFGPGRRCARRCAGRLVGTIRRRALERRGQQPQIARSGRRTARRAPRRGLSSARLRWPIRRGSPAGSRGCLPRPPDPRAAGPAGSATTRCS